MKRILLAAAVVASALVGTTAVAAVDPFVDTGGSGGEDLIDTGKGQGKAIVCHVEGDGDIHPISIADPAVDKHLAHGDLQPGVLSNGKILGDDCKIVTP